jgi:hypothetical protein
MSAVDPIMARWMGRVKLSQGKRGRKELDSHLQPWWVPELQKQKR